MMKKQDFENYIAESQITIGNKITEVINKLNKAITVKLENNKGETIQCLKNEISLLQNCVGKLECQICLLEDAMINNAIKLNNADHYSRRNIIVIQGIPQSVKSKDLEDKVINVPDKVNAKLTKNGIEACCRLAEKSSSFVSKKHSFEALKELKMLISVDLPRIWLYKIRNLFLTRNWPDYNDKIAFHCRELRQKRLIDPAWAYGGKVFLKIEDNSNRDEIKNLSQFTRKIPNHIFNFDD